MAQITAALVKELREKSGAGMMDCKKALTETEGNLDAAVDWLRTKGLASAAKKSGRLAAEGLVGVAVEGTTGAVVEVNAETDFVARNADFQAFVRNVSQLALSGDGTLEGLAAMAYPGTGKPVSEQLTDLIATIGENMTLRRVAKLSVESGVVAPYVHGALDVDKTVGKIGVLVALETGADAAAATDMAKGVAMHVAATQPASLSVDDLDQALIEREKAVLTEQAKESGRPPEVIEKMIVGRLQKYYQEVVLLEQQYVVDLEAKKKVGDVVAEFGKAQGGTAKVTGFVRFTLGEGLEKKEEDFAEEVKKLTS